VLLTGDPTSHAEVTAIRKAAEVLNPWAPAIGGRHHDQSTLEMIPRPPGDSDPSPARARTMHDATLYSSAFPCLMCLGAVSWSRISQVLYGCSADAAAVGFDDAFIDDDFSRPLHARRVRLEQLGRALGLKALRAWADLPDRHPN
jgi:tRNA(Arg) A34 adenosine deaminase TadA